jgi:hypothetical protein
MQSKNTKTEVLTKKDINALVGSTQKYYILSICIIVFLIAFFVFIAGYDFYLSLHYANLYGLDFSNTVSLWNEEPTLKRIYSGYEHLSIHRLNMSILSLGMAIIFSLQLWVIISTRKRNQRILSVLVQSGEISKEQVKLSLKF